MLGVLGNLATCLVIIKNEYMRTTTNIYLFNLAIADLGTLVLAMPAELYLMWRQYPWTFGEVPTLKYTKVLLICWTDNTSDNPRKLFTRQCALILKILLWGDVILPPAFVKVWTD